MLINYKFLGDYEFNYEYLFFAPKNLEEVGDITVKLEGRIEYFIEEVYNAFAEDWQRIEKTGIAALWIADNPVESYYHSLVNLEWDFTPAHSDLDLESKGDSQSLVISFKNKEIEEAFIKLLKNWGSISSARSYEKPTRYPDNVTPRFRDHTDSLKSWLALIDLIMLNYRKEDNSKEFNNCAKDLDITKSNKLISYEPQSIMAAVADHILGSGLGTCEYCSKPFLKNRKDMKYCSNSCRVRYSQNDKKRKLG